MNKTNTFQSLFRPVISRKERGAAWPSLERREICEIQKKPDSSSASTRSASNAPSEWQILSYWAFVQNLSLICISWDL